MVALNFDLMQCTEMQGINPNKILWYDVFMQFRVFRFQVIF